MKEPKYEPLKMGDKKHADKYGAKMRKYLKQKNDLLKTSHANKASDSISEIIITPTGKFCTLYKKNCIGDICSVTSNWKKCPHLEK